MRILRSLLSEQSIRERDFFLRRSNRLMALEIEIVNGLLALPSCVWTKAGQRLVPSSALTVLDAWAALLPARIANEDLGDYVEDIQKRILKGQRKLVFLRMMAAVLWTSLSTSAYFIGKVREILGRSRAN